MDTKSTSTWFALQNPVFCRLWLANVLSGTFASAQDIAATWLMHGLGASAFALSFMATAASAPFFLFTLPAGAVADIVNRRTLLVGAVLVAGSVLSSPRVRNMDGSCPSDFDSCLYFRFGHWACLCRPGHGSDRARISSIKMNCPLPSRWEECS